MDATMQTVIRLYEQGCSMKEIERRKICGTQKIRKILINAGLYESPRMKQVNALRSAGKTDTQIAELLGIARNTVNSYHPYEKGMYNAEYPSKNALRIRETREKQARAKSE